MRLPSRLLTTGQVARLCDASPSAVLKWIRAGKLPTYSTPGGQYRVAREALCGFLRKYGMHVPPELSQQARHRVLILTEDELTRASLLRLVEASGLPCQAECIADGVLGCMRVAELAPHLVVFDLAMRKPDAADFCRAVKAHACLASTRILVLAAEPDSVQVQRALIAGADGWLGKPVAFEHLLAKFHELLGVEGARAPEPPLRPAGSPVQEKSLPPSEPAPLASTLAAS